MKKKFYELISTYASKSGFTSNCKDGDLVASMSYETYQIHFALMENLGVIIIQAGVAIMPNHSKEKIYQAVLQKNNLFQGTGGLTFGLDMEQEMLTLQFLWPIQKLDEYIFANLLSNFLAVIAAAIQEIEDLIIETQVTNDINTSQNGTDELAPYQMLKI